MYLREGSQKTGKSRRSPFPEPVAPFPGWKRSCCRLSRPVAPDDIDAFLKDQELYVRETAKLPVTLIHTWGVLEIHAIPGVGEIEVWFSPDHAVWVSEYLDALLATRF